MNPFYDEFIAPSNMEYNINDLGSFFDERYRDSELPDDFFIENYPDAFRTLDDTFISKEYDIDGAGIVRQVVLPDCAKDEHFIAVGPRDVEKPKIYIDPDYTPALRTLIWYMSFMNSEEPLDLPYIPVAEPVIPAIMLQIPPTISVFDDFFSDHEGLIFCPYYAFTTVNPSYKFVVGDIEEEVNIQLNSRMQAYDFKFCFSSKYPFYESFAKYNYKWIWLEFNPFHPMSPRMIESYEDDGIIIKGTYKWGRKIKPFVFDRNDRKYRIHSEVWSRTFTEAYKYFCSFDIVGNYDFLKDVPDLVSIPQRMYRYPGKYCEMVSVSGEVDTYSPMILPRSGEGKKYPYFSNKDVTIGNYSGIYYNLTQFYATRSSDGVVYVERVRDGFCVAKFKMDSLYYVDERYFVLYTFKGNLAVYINSSLIDFEFPDKDYPDTSCRKVFVKDLYYVGMPRNRLGSLIDAIGMVSYDTFFKQTREFSLTYFDSAPLTDKSSDFSNSFDIVLNESIDLEDVVYEQEVGESGIVSKPGSVVDIIDEGKLQTIIYPEKIVRGLRHCDDSNYKKDNDLSGFDFRDRYEEREEKRRIDKDVDAISKGIKTYKGRVKFKK